MNAFRKFICGSPQPPLAKNIGIEVTSSCNSRCLMCSRQYLGKEREKSELSLSDFKKIIAQFAGIKTVQFCGYCESLLNKDIFQMISCAGEGVESILVTNGKLLSEENSYRLIDAGLQRAHISHHGLGKDEFLRMRQEGDENVYDQVNSNIKGLVLARKNRKSSLSISINYAVSSINYASLPEFVVFAHELGVDAVTPLQLTIIPGKTDSLYIERELEWALKEGARKAKALKMRFMPFSAFNYGVCREMWETVQIQSNGNVLPCMGYFPDEASVGNIFEKNIKDIWNNNEYIAYRKSVINGAHEKCRNCQLGNQISPYNKAWIINRYIRPFIRKIKNIQANGNEP